MENIESTLELSNEELELISGGKKQVFVKTSEGATVRIRPGRDQQVIGRPKPGTLLCYLGETKKTSDGLSWAKINFEGFEGWVSSKFSKFA